MNVDAARRSTARGAAWRCSAVGAAARHAHPHAPRGASERARRAAASTWRRRKGLLANSAQRSRRAPAACSAGSHSIQQNLGGAAAPRCAVAAPGQSSAAAQSAYPRRTHSALPAASRSPCAWRRARRLMHARQRGCITREVRLRASGRSAAATHVAGCSPAHLTAQPRRCARRNRSWSPRGTWR